jgi:hypothetical protein
MMAWSLCWISADRNIALIFPSFNFMISAGWVNSDPTVTKPFLQSCMEHRWHPITGTAFADQSYRLHVYVLGTLGTSTLPLHNGFRQFYCWIFHTWVYTAHGDALFLIVVMFTFTCFDPFAINLCTMSTCWSFTPSKGKCPRIKMFS